MECERCQELMVDVLYGEEVDTADSLRFFSHMNECSACDRSYVELIEARGFLGEWALPREELERDGLADWKTPSRLPGWPVLQRIAAAVLMLLGVAYALQTVGVLPGGSRPVSQEQLRELVQDVVVARQDESLRTIGEALLSLKEEFEMRNRAQMQSVYDDIYTLEQRWLEELDRRNRRVSSAREQ